MSTAEVVLITGAGSGIGCELTRIFLASGARVLAVSLLQEELDTLQAELNPEQTNLSTLTMDLTVNDAAEQLVNYCDSNALVVDTLVNNAGFACYGDAVDENIAKISAMIALNVVCVTKLSLLFGRQMQARKQGNILNVGSTAGMLPAARFAAYSGTKSYVNSFSYALRSELAPFNVNVTCLTPCAVATKFASAANIDKFKGESQLKDLFSNNKASLPADIAQAGYDGLRAKKAQVLTGKGKLMAWLLHRLVPQSKLPSVLKNM